MKLSYSETKFANLWIENDILFIKCLPNTVITRKAAEEIISERIKITRGNFYPVFMDIRNVKYITMDARNCMKQTEGLQYVSAYAFLFDSHVHNILINYFLTLKSPALPAKPVSKRGQALSWLENYKTSVIDSKTNFANTELVA